MATDVKTEKPKPLSDKELIAAYKKAQADLKAGKARLKEIQDTDYTKYAQGLEEKMFSRFSQGARWLEDQRKSAQQKLVVTSPLGRRRNLMSNLMGIPGIVAAMDRRAMNSPIQGFSSDISVKACRLVAIEFHKYLKRWYADLQYEVLPAQILKFVHDALYSEVPYMHILPFIHILQWMATYGITKVVQEEFNIKFTIEPEIEIEIGASEDKMYKWDWSDPDLRTIITKSLEDQKAINHLKRLDKKGNWVDCSVEQALKDVYAPYENRKMRKWLETKYPILGVFPDGSTVKGVFKDSDG